MRTTKIALSTLIAGVLVAATACGSSDDAASSSTSASTAAADTIRITFVRHAESAGNAGNIADGSVPGPNITPDGKVKAEQVATTLAATNPDGLYASQLRRTQQSAQPLADKTKLPITVLDGLAELDMGSFEGGKQDALVKPMNAEIIAWAQGKRDGRIGGGESGDEFDKRWDDAVAKIVASGDKRPVAYAHYGSIAAGVLMNTSNSDVALFRDHPLKNLAVIVIEGSPTAGWKIVDWQGQKVS